MWPAQPLAFDTDIARQRGQESKDLLDRFKTLQATNLPVSVDRDNSDSIDDDLVSTCT